MILRREDLIEKMAPLKPEDSLYALDLLARFDALEDRSRTSGPCLLAISYAETFSGIASAIPEEHRNPDSLHLAISHIVGKAINLGNDRLTR